MLHSWLLAFFPLGVQRAIWKEDPDALIAAAFTPSMQVHLVEGGFRISGTSPFVSAIDPASWCLLAGWTPEEDEQPKQLRLFLLERRQYEILDDWDVLGLKGSGSKSVVVRDIFVPHEHTINLLRLRDGGASCHPQKLYQLPLLAIAPLVVLGPIVGATVGAYHFWLSLMAKDQTALGQERIAEFSHVQIRCSELEAALSMAQAFTTSTLQLLSSTQEISPAMRVLIRRNYAAVGSICREVIVELFSSGGAYWIKEQHPMQRYLRDILAACQHTALRLDEVATQHGRTLLDLPLTFIHELY